MRLFFYMAVISVVFICSLEEYRGSRPEGNVTSAACCSLGKLTDSHLGGYEVSEVWGVITPRVSVVSDLWLGLAKEIFSFSVVALCQAIMCYLILGCSETEMV